MFYSQHSNTVTLNIIPVKMSLTDFKQNGNEFGASMMPFRTKYPYHEILCAQASILGLTASIQQLATFHPDN